MSTTVATAASAPRAVSLARWIGNLVANAVEQVAKSVLDTRVKSDGETAAELLIMASRYERTHPSFAADLREAAAMYSRNERAR